MEGKIKKIIIDLHIPEHFPDYDKNLLYLAFMPADSSYQNGAVYNALKEIHPYAKDINYNVLEFYGDEVLYMLILEIFREFNGTRNTLFFMDKLKKSLTTNIYLRQLSHDLKICDTIYGINRGRKLPAHNHCSDSFEALLGALYVQYGLTGLDRIQKWFIDTFPQVLNEARKQLSPYMYIPVRNVGTGTEDTILRFEELNPRCKIKYENGEYVMYIDDLQYDHNPILENLIPIINDKKLPELWVNKRYSHVLLDDEKYICNKPPFRFNCNSTATNRISMYNPRVKSCKPVYASGACNILTDDLPLKKMAKSCMLPPYRYFCKNGIRHSKQSTNAACPQVKLGREESTMCQADDTYVDMSQSDLLDAKYKCSFVDGKLQRTGKYSKNGKAMMLNNVESHDCNVLTDTLPLREISNGINLLHHM